MALALVHLLEVVEVHEHHRERPAGAAAALHLAAQRLVQGRVVHAAGERIGPRRLGKVGVDAGVAAGHGRELGEALEEVGVLVEDHPVPRPSRPHHAAELAIPPHWDRQRRADVGERGADGRGRVAHVVVGEQRAAEVEGARRDPARLLHGAAGLLGDAGRIERERRAGRAAEHQDAVRGEDRRGLLADAR